MPIRKANAVWTGNLKEGKGNMKLESGAFEGSYSFSSRFEEGTGTNPEELIGAAHAGCFSMALAGNIAQAGYQPKSIKTEAEVNLNKIADGFEIASIILHSEADVPDIDAAEFLELADGAKKNCPVSKALLGVEITLDAKLAG
ncbi:OsmC family peroxiredoxin [candidate division KSB1 bacterium]|nr:OsmC family peroxiredoxin [candidate division KSB1 bacterium]